MIESNTKPNGSPTALYLHIDEEDSSDLQDKRDAIV